MPTPQVAIKASAILNSTVASAEGVDSAVAESRGEHRDHKTPVCGTEGTAAPEEGRAGGDPQVTADGTLDPPWSCDLGGMAARPSSVLRRPRATAPLRTSPL